VSAESGQRLDWTRGRVDRISVRAEGHQWESSRHERVSNGRLVPEGINGSKGTAKISSNGCQNLCCFSNGYGPSLHGPPNVPPMSRGKLRTGVDVVPGGACRTGAYSPALGLPRMCSQAGVGSNVMKWALGRAWIYSISRKTGMMFLSHGRHFEKGKMTRSRRIVAFLGCNEFVRRDNMLLGTVSVCVRGMIDSREFSR
jgi:hypothetical protein